MIDILEKATIHDIGLAKTLGIDSREVERLSLYKMKNEMHIKAFRMRRNEETITQDEADSLNARLEEIIDNLIEYDYEPMEDYIIDFDNFVVGNEHYNKFYW